MAIIKPMECILCKSIVKTEWLNLSDVINDNTIPPYRSYECPICGYYVSLDRPWLDAFGYDIEKVRVCFQNSTVSNCNLRFFGERDYYDKLKKRNSNILYIKPNK